ncbi:MAG: hypothetical protein H6832_17745 [Planctomycetes bacterium]|nr:hypothetical protein [Planctomycetota bacterium]MCB9920250.1 hypothetical protein [Planctomycetota bacterium]
MRVATLDAAIRAYADGGRLLVAGSVPLEDGKARRLAAELADNGHWVAVLAASAVDLEQTWVRRLGIGLRAETSFGRDARDSILLIALEPRTIRLSLGTGYTEGGGISEGDASLIEPARRALRDGVRVDDAIRDTIATVERRYAAALRFPWLIGGGAALGFAGLTGAAALARRRKRRRAIARYDEWSKLLGEQAGALIELKRWGRILSANPRYRGKTKQLADGIVTDVQHIALIRGGILEALDHAKDLIWPSGAGRWLNTVTSWRYDKALDVMSRAKVRFDADGDLARALRGEAIGDGELTSIWEAAREVRRESRTFDELVGEQSTRAKRVDDVVKRIQKCTQIVESSLNVLRARIDRFANSINEFETLTDDDSRCRLDALRASLLASFEREYETTRTIALPDPVLAVDESGRAERRLQRAEELLEDLVQIVHEALPNVASGKTALSTQGIQVDWIDRRVRSIFEDANVWFESLAKDGQDVGNLAPPSIFDATSKTFDDMARALDIARSRHDIGIPAISGLRGEVMSERVRIAERLHLDASAILVEHDANPDEYLARASEKLDASVESLGSGELEEAASLVADATRETQAAREILDDTRAALARFGERSNELSSRVGSIVEQSIPETEPLVESLALYADSALQRHHLEGEVPEGRTSIRSNVTEAKEHVRAARRCLESASSLHRSGGILQGDHELNRAESFLKLALLRLQELTERRALLTRTEEDNERAVRVLDDLARDVTRSRTGREVTLATGSKIDEAARAFAAIADLPSTGRDPFARSSRIDEARALLHAARSGIDADRAMRAEAARSLDLAREMSSQARTRSEDARRDHIPDSDRILEAARRIPEIDQRLDGFARELDEPHRDWVELDARIDAMHAQAFDIKSTLDREIEAGRVALRDIERAGEAVREAASYTDSSFGIRLPGSPGRAAHVRAKELLERGRYEEASRMASSAVQEARDAIAMAERTRRSFPSSRGGGFGLPSGGRIGGIDVGNLVRDIFQQATIEWSGHRRYQGPVGVPRIPDAGRRSPSTSSQPSSTSRPQSAPEPTVRDSPKREDDSGFGPSFDW